MCSCSGARGLQKDEAGSPAQFAGAGAKLRHVTVPGASWRRRCWSCHASRHARNGAETQAEEQGEKKQTENRVDSGAKRGGRHRRAPTLRLTQQVPAASPGRQFPPRTEQPEPGRGRGARSAPLGLSPQGAVGLGARLHPRPVRPPAMFSREAPRPSPWGPPAVAGPPAPPPGQMQPDARAPLPTHILGARRCCSPTPSRSTDAPRAGRTREAQADGVISGGDLKGQSGPPEPRQPPALGWPRRAAQASSRPPLQTSSLRSEPV